MYVYVYVYTYIHHQNWQLIGKTFYNFCHWVKSVRIRSYSGPYFPSFGLNKERYGVSIRIQSECGKMWIRITPNTDTFYEVCSITFVFFLSPICT